MSSFSDLFADFKNDLALMREGIAFVQSAYKGIGLLREGRAQTQVAWPAEVTSAMDNITFPNRKTENLTYDGAVVLLSATYEVYARDTVEAICREIEKKIPRFDDLNEKIKSENARATGRVLSRHKDKRFSQFDYLNLSKFLGTCVAGSENYKLNSGPLASHDRNLSSSELNVLFSRLGIEKFWEQMGESASILRHFETTKPQVAQKDATVKLDEFVTLRNQVAHAGGGETSTGPEALARWMDFFVALSEGLSKVAADHCDKLTPTAITAPAPLPTMPAPEVGSPGASQYALGASIPQEEETTNE